MGVAGDRFDFQHRFQKKRSKAPLVSSESSGAFLILPSHIAGHAMDVPGWFL